MSNQRGSQICVRGCGIEYGIIGEDRDNPESLQSEDFDNNSSTLRILPESPYTKPLQGSKSFFRLSSRIFAVLYYPKSKEKEIKLRKKR